MEIWPSAQSPVPFPQPPAAAGPAGAGFMSWCVAVTDSSNEELCGAEDREGNGVSWDSSSLLQGMC